MSTVPLPLDPNQLPLRQQPKPLPVTLPVANGAPQQSQNAAVPPIPRTTGQTSTIPQAAFGAEPSATERQRTLQTQGSGISRIHNPFLKGLATVGDVIAGTFAPRAEQLIPGTEGNYALHLARARNAVQGEDEQQNAATRRGLEEAQTEHARAQAQALENAPEKANEIPVKAGEGIWDKNARKWLVEPTDPEGATEIDPDYGKELHIVPTKDGRYLLPKGGASLLKPKSEMQPKTLLEKAMADHPEWKAEDLQEFLNKTPKAKEFSAEDAALIRAVGGDPEKPESLTLPVLKKYIANKQPPQRPPQVQFFTPTPEGGFTTGVARGAGAELPPGAAIGAAGVNTPTVLRNREAQGKIINEAGNQLLASIEKHRDKIGNLGSYWRQYTNGTPISDPDTSALMAQLGSFAALQPTLHGFRGQQALAEFEKIIGGVPKNADALEAAIRAIQGTAQIIERGGNPAPGGAGAGGGVPSPASKAEYDALPRGAHYMKNGTEMIKQ